MKNCTEIQLKLSQLLMRLIDSEVIVRNDSNEFADWEHSFNGNYAVYILWKQHPRSNLDIRPVYIGEGILGRRIWEHYYKKRNWKFVQYITDDSLTDIHFRKLFERYCIVVLEPTENHN